MVLIAQQLPAPAEGSCSAGHSNGQHEADLMKRVIKEPSSYVALGHHPHGQDFLRLLVSYERTSAELGVHELVGSTKPIWDLLTGAVQGSRPQTPEALGQVQNPFNFHWELSIWPALRLCQSHWTDK